jgi:hypothetical protein
MNIDAVNGVFETLGALFILLSVRKLYNEKLVRGVSYWHISFFMVWGFWNLFYYPALGQVWSFLGGALLVVTNVVYVGQLIYYTQTENRRFYLQPRDYE